MSDLYKLLERYKAGDHSKELLNEFILTCAREPCLEFDEEDSPVVKQLLTEYTESLGPYICTKCGKEPTEFGRMVTKARMASKRCVRNAQTLLPGR